jgi:predicted Holliday junction resolvase-like endonuclease
MAKADKKQSKSATKVQEVTKTKPVSTKDILAKAKKAVVEAVCLDIVPYFPNFTEPCACLFLETQAYP